MDCLCTVHPIPKLHCHKVDPHRCRAGLFIHHHHHHHVCHNVLNCHVGALYEFTCQLNRGLNEGGKDKAERERERERGEGGEGRDVYRVRGRGKRK